MDNNLSYVDALKILSPREIEIIELVEKGFLNKEIAKSLNISRRTVQNHRQNICKKLNLKGRNSLLKWIIKVK